MRERPERATDFKKYSYTAHVSPEGGCWWCEGVQVPTDTTVQAELKWINTEAVYKEGLSFPKEAEILQLQQQNDGEFLSVSCGRCSVLSCGLLGEQQQSRKHQQNE